MNPSSSCSLPAVIERSRTTVKSTVTGSSTSAGRRIPSSLAVVLLVCIGSVAASPTNSEDGEHDLTVICGQFPDLATCLEAHQQQEWTRHVAEKRKSAYMRFGRSAGASDLDADAYGAMEKRKSAYMRFGKRDAGELLAAPAEKRKSAYMRFGKRDVEAAAAAPMEKRKSAYMRFGKRASDNQLEGPLMEKRKSAYMRFGRK